MIVFVALSMGNSVLQIIFEGVTKKIDEGNAVDVAKVDFNKAFGKVPHCGVVFKIRSRGIQGNLAN